MNRSNNNDIDRLFQSHFDLHDVAVRDSVALWNKIHPKRDNRWVLLFLLLGLISTVGFSYISFTDHSNKVISNKHQSSQGIVQSIKYPKIVNLPSNAIDPTPQDNKSIPTINPNETKSFDDRARKTIESQHSNNLKKTNTDNKSDKITPPPTYAHQAPTINRDPASKLEIKKEVGTNTKATNDSKFENNSILFSSYEVLSSSSKEEFSTTKIAANNSISPFEINLEPSEVNALFIKDNNPLNNCIPGLGGHPYIDIYSVLGNPMETLSLRPEFEDQINYLTDWQSRYTTLPSISMGFMLGYELKSGLDIAIGAEYQSMESQYKTTQTVTEIVTVYDPMAFFYYDDNNEVVWQGDSVTAVSTFDRTVSVANIHRLLHIP